MDLNRPIKAHKVKKKQIIQFTESIIAFLIDQHTNPIQKINVTSVKKIFKEHRGNRSNEKQIENLL